MKVLSTEGLTKLIDLIKSNFISSADTQATTVVDTVETNVATLATVATTGSYNDLSGTPALATVATTGSYNDLSNKPDLTDYALDADVVHKTGDENYTGLKTNIITLDLSQRTFTDCNVINTNVDATTTQSFYHDLYTDIIRDTNGNYLSWNTTVIGTNKAVNKQISARCKNTDNTGNVTSAIQVCASPNGSTWATAPASDINGSIITTVNKSKASNGYLQLGNGIIIQWGFYENTGSQANKTLNLNKAFSNTNYKITMTQKYDSSSTYDANAYIKSKTTTTVTFRCPSGGVEWIAIGY